MAKTASGLFESFPCQLVLASSSPRRQELLGHLGIPFCVKVPDIEEKRRLGEDPAQYVQRNAKEKAQAVALALDLEKPCIIIGSDTIGVLDGEVLEKPRDAADAARMLKSLSGRRHEVITGVSGILKRGQNLHSEDISVTTKVYFKDLSLREISYYVGTGEPLDKAGSYGIQGIGGIWVERLEGSYSNVVGLPLAELVIILQKLISRLD